MPAARIIERGTPRMLWLQPAVPSPVVCPVVMPSRASFSIALPADFRPRDVLDFHARDAQALAERVTGAGLQKGLVWADRAARLEIRFVSGQAEVELAVDGGDEIDRDALARMARRMLGLTQPIEEFERTYRRHPQLGRLIAQRPGLRVPLSATPFEALTWAIAGQQISVGAAVSLRRKFIQAAGLRHSGGLLCYPEATQVARLSEADLRRAGFSLTKAQALLALSRAVAENRLPLASWLETLPVEEMRAQLLALRGIGPWTVNYALLRGFGWLDGSLHGDAAVRRGLQRLLGGADKMDEDAARRWLAEFSPWRALVAAHLWAWIATNP